MGSPNEKSLFVRSVQKLERYLAQSWSYQRSRLLKTSHDDDHYNELELLEILNIRGAIHQVGREFY